MKRLAQTGITVFLLIVAGLFTAAAWVSHESLSSHLAATGFILLLFGVVLAVVIAACEDLL